MAWHLLTLALDWKFWVGPEGQGQTKPTVALQHQSGHERDFSRPYRADHSSRI